MIEHHVHKQQAALSYHQEAHLDDIFHSRIQKHFFQFLRLARVAATTVVLEYAIQECATIKSGC